MLTLRDVDIDVYKYKSLDIREWYRKIPKDFVFYEIVKDDAAAADLKIDVAEFHKFFVVSDEYIGQLSNNCLHMMQVKNSESLLRELSILEDRHQIKKCNANFTKLLLTVMLWTSYIDMPQQLEKLLLSCTVPPKYKTVSVGTIYRTLKLHALRKKAARLA